MSFFLLLLIFLTSTLNLSSNQYFSCLGWWTFAIETCYPCNPPPPLPPSPPTPLPRLYCSPTQPLFPTSRVALGWTIVIHMLMACSSLRSRPPLTSHMAPRPRPPAPAPPADPLTPPPPLPTPHKNTCNKLIKSTFALCQSQTIDLPTCRRRGVDGFWLEGQRKTSDSLILAINSHHSGLVYVKYHMVLLVFKHRMEIFFSEQH